MLWRILRQRFNRPHVEGGPPDGGLLFHGELRLAKYQKSQEVGYIPQGKLGEQFLPQGEPPSKPGRPLCIDYDLGGDVQGFSLALEHPLAWQVFGAVFPEVGVPSKW